MNKTSMMISAILAVAAISQTANANDGVPQTAVTFFNAESCPADWLPYNDLEGRFIIPLANSTGVGTQSGNQIPATSEQPEPTHTHDFNGNFDISKVEYALIAGSGYSGLGHSGSQAFSGVSDFSSVQLPYIRLLACEKASAPPSGAPELAKDSVLFFNASNCPTGWSTTPTLAGRFLVGLPAGGQAGASFGGNSLSPGDQPAHTHPFTANTSTHDQPLVGASGCCAHDYAKNDSYTDKGTSDAVQIEYPYQQLLSCEKD